MENSLLLILSKISLYIYIACLCFISIYMLSHLILLINVFRAKKRTIQEQKEASTLKSLYTSGKKKLPFVTIQLPIYNEYYVVKRLLKSISSFKYPIDKYEIQVLDDSTDETSDIVKKELIKIREKGIITHHIQRKNRVDFKAGALKEGLKTAKGEYIAIFDADFIPKPDWLINTMSHFSEDNIGLVQTKWDYINRNNSLLTKIQSFALNIHFYLEHIGRHYRNYFINFNGTAGIWRKKCITSSGNWNGDSLAEDLNLSYRCQLNDWKFKYVESIKTPSELPITIKDLKTQQFRWNKGGAENLRQLGSSLLKADNIPADKKLFGILHLFASHLFFFIFVSSILSVPLLYVKNQWGHLALYFSTLQLFSINTIIFFACYWFVYKNGKGKSFLEYMKLFFSFSALFLGLSFSNTIAVFQGLFGIKSEFIRTPKYNVSNRKRKKRRKKYLKKSISKTFIFEIIICLYFFFGMYSAFVVGESGDFGLFPFHLLAFLGYIFMLIEAIILRYKKAE